MIRNILISGVGGQGSLLASRILGHVFTQQGLAVKVNEVHGMSQRGGSVVTTVRAGQTVHSPLIPDGEVDLLIALEQLEALRWVHTLRPDGVVLVNTQKILPMPVITGAAQYPDTIVDSLKEHPGLCFDAVELAQEAGNLKSVNVVMMGAASRFLDAPEEIWLNALDACVKPRFLDVNKAAFHLGRKSIPEAQL